MVLGEVLHLVGVDTNVRLDHPGVEGDPAPVGAVLVGAVEHPLGEDEGLAGLELDRNRRGRDGRIRDHRLEPVEAALSALAERDRSSMGPWDHVHTAVVDTGVGERDPDRELEEALALVGLEHRQAIFKAVDRRVVRHDRGGARLLGEELGAPNPEVWTHQLRQPFDDRRSPQKLPHAGVCQVEVAGARKAVHAGLRRPVAHLLRQVAGLLCGDHPKGAQVSVLEETLPLGVIDAVGDLRWARPLGTSALDVELQR